MMKGAGEIASSPETAAPRSLNIRNTSQPKFSLFESRFTSAARRWTRFWFSFLMMWNLERRPELLRFGKPFFTAMAWRTSAYLRSSLTVNARRLLGAHATTAQHKALAQRMLSNFYDFIVDIASTVRMSDDELLAQVSEVHGRDRYLQTRALGRGAILVTAHLGSFETGVAALRRDEPRIHVVFRRDPMVRFERLRTAQRRRLGVIEAPIDEGLGVWLKLRDALMNNEVVLMQGDRVMPGQKGLRVPFLDGHMMVPTGPVKLAMATGTPLVPIFAPRMPDQTVRIILEEPILVDPSHQPQSGPHPAQLHLINVIERYVRQYAEQWLMVHPALCEDQPELRKWPVAIGQLSERTDN